MILTEDLKSILYSQARKHKPYEMCGVLIKLHNSSDNDYKYIPVTNVHDFPREAFMLDPKQLYDLKQQHIIAAVVHSHTGSAQPSGADISQCNTHKLPYIIVSSTDGSITITQPSTTPLLGRSYVHGTDDCYGIVRDFYNRELGIDLPDYERQDMWWVKDNSASLYVDNFESAGFIQIPKTTIADLQYGDFLICYWGETLYPNHGLIWLGDKTSFTSEETPTCVGDRLYLHHMYDSISTRTVMGEQRFSTVSHVLRHKEMINAN